jgi:hypothetical protein
VWHQVLQRLPQRWARLLRAPQSLRYVAGRFENLHRFVTFEGRERRLTLPSGAVLRGRDPAVAVGPDGRVLIVYEAGGGRGLRYVSATLNPDGALVGEDYPLLEDEVCPGYTPAVAINQHGRVLVVYQQSQDEELTCVSALLDPSSGRIAGRRFSLAQGEPPRGRTPAVDLDENGRFIVAYQRANTREIRYIWGTLERSGRLNGTPVPLTPDQVLLGSHPAVAFDPEGSAFLLCEEPADHSFHYVHGPLQSGRPAGPLRPLRIGMERS